MDVRATVSPVSPRWPRPGVAPGDSCSPHVLGHKVPHPELSGTRETVRKDRLRSFGTPIIGVGAEAATLRLQLAVTATRENSRQVGLQLGKPLDVRRPDGAAIHVARLAVVFGSAVASPERSTEGPHPERFRQMIELERCTQSSGMACVHRLPEVDGKGKRPVDQLRHGSEVVLGEEDLWPATVISDA